MPTWTGRLKSEAAAICDECAQREKCVSIFPESNCAWHFFPEARVKMASASSRIECPVCLEAIAGREVSTCHNGHVFCKSCRDKVTTCPLCRGDFPSVEKVTVVAAAGTTRAPPGTSAPPGLTSALIDAAIAGTLTGASANQAHADSSLLLRLAAKHGRDSTVGMLLRAGADVNACNGQALIDATTANHPSTVKILLLNGASPTVRGNEAVRLARERPAMLQLYKTYCPKLVKEEDYGTLDDLLQGRGSPEFRARTMRHIRPGRDDCQRLIKVAIKHDVADFVKWLMSLHGDEVGLNDVVEAEAGKTLVMLTETDQFWSYDYTKAYQELFMAAVERNKPKIVREMLELGADPNYNSGEALYYVAAVLRSLEMCRLLLDFGAKVFPRKVTTYTTDLRLSSLGYQGIKYLVKERESCYTYRSDMSTELRTDYVEYMKTLNSYDMSSDVVKAIKESSSNDRQYVAPYRPVVELIQSYDYRREIWVPTVGEKRWWVNPRKVGESCVVC